MQDSPTKWSRFALVVILGIVFAGPAGISQAAEPHPTLDQHRPKAAGAVIKAVSLCASDRDVFDGKRVGTAFADGVARVIVWYRWEGAKTGHRVTVRWSLEGATVLEEGEAIATPWGSAAWILKTTGDPLPPGNYRVELLENGQPVTVIPFRVGAPSGGGVAMLEQYKPTAAGAAIRAVSLSASDTDDFDSRRTGTEFPAGVRRVVVYYLWEGVGPGHRVDSRWLQGDTLVGERQQMLTTATGFGVFSIGPLSAGSYRVELTENGKAVTTIPFRIRQ